MKKKWEEPSVMIQEFVPNEYVAACYTLACSVGPSHTNAPYGFLWNSPERGDVSHSSASESGTCADASANRIITNDNGVIVSIGEHNNQQGWLRAELDEWVDVNEDGICNPGDVIYWHTVSRNGDRRWNHWGYAAAEIASRPNHS